MADIGHILTSWIGLTLAGSKCCKENKNSRVSNSLSNSGLCWTIFTRNRDTAVPAEGNGDLQTLIYIQRLCSSAYGALQICLWYDMIWSVCLWRDPDDVSQCRILSPDKTEWQLISATLCRWKCCFVADQLWLMKHIRNWKWYHSKGRVKSPIHIS